MDLHIFIKINKITTYFFCRNINSNEHNNEAIIHYLILISKTEIDDAIYAPEGEKGRYPTTTPIGTTTNEWEFDEMIAFLSFPS